MSILYHKWLDDHNERPYSHSEDKLEKSLGKWVNKLRIKAVVPADIVEKCGQVYINPLREYREWKYVYKRYPRWTKTGSREATLAQWAAIVKNQYQEGKLSNYEIAQIEKVLGKKWLPD